MNETDKRYFILNKPTNMVSQFIGIEKARLLTDLDFDFDQSCLAVPDYGWASSIAATSSLNRRVVGARAVQSSEFHHFSTIAQRQ